MKEITLEQAIEIAKEDYYYGVMDAMVKLNKMGFETPIYWAFLKQIGDNDMEFDEYEMNTDCRDVQYRALNIFGTMRKAYDIVWGR